LGGQRLEFWALILLIFLIGSDHPQNIIIENVLLFLSNITKRSTGLAPSYLQTTNFDRCIEVSKRRQNPETRLGYAFH